MDLSRAALVVVDVQQGFVNEHSEPVVPQVLELVEAWRGAGLPLVLAKFYNAPGSPYERISGWLRLRTPEEQALVPALQAYAQDAELVVEKPVSSALTAELAQRARERAWTDLVVCGIDTDSCVYDTAVAAYHGGLTPWIVTDACASSGGDEPHEAALLLARRNIGEGQLTTVSAVLADLADVRAAQAVARSRPAGAEREGDVHA
ncbi:isochorismatase family cysteine hydrolase [Streptomyces tendae]|uniref:isochorismatase family cysteine hydrolase n=1 Tax=Streptomyces tendae TaxID=1932 RepID=UPI003EB7CB1F